MNRAKNTKWGVQKIKDEKEEYQIKEENKQN